MAAAATPAGLTLRPETCRGQPYGDDEEEQEEVTEPVTKAERISRKVFSY